MKHFLTIWVMMSVFLVGLNQAKGQQVLLIPESTFYTIGMYDPFDGDFLGNLISGYGLLDTPVNAVQGPDGNIYVSDQLEDSVFVFDKSGAYLYTFADASSGLNNIRGIDFYDTHLFVTSGDDYVAEFDETGTRLPDFISDGSDPFDIYFLSDGTAFLADIQGATDNVRYYHADGTLDHEIFNVSFPKQISEGSSGVFLNASSTMLFSTFDVTGLINQVLLGAGNGGIYELGNGNYLATHSSIPPSGGVFEIDPSTGSVVDIIRQGISAKFIELVDLTTSPTPTPTNTQPPTETPVVPTATPTTTQPPTETPVVPTATPTTTQPPTETPVVPTDTPTGPLSVPATGFSGLLVMFILMGAAMGGIQFRKKLSG